MSLTNPNTVVTEQRLNDFYKGILPYLGGMPEMVANKFSKGDLYSTDEKMIGQWIDGKPLYQKTIVKNNFEVRQNASFAHGISNVDHIFIKEGHLTDDTGSVIVPLVWSDTYDGVYINATDVAFKGTGVWGALTTRTIYLTIRYTKTTDSAISIGNDTDYSTDEKIVGTWIDGEPVYQKTFNGSYSIGSTPVVINDIQVTDVCTLISEEFVADGGTSGSRYTFTPSLAGFTNENKLRCAIVGSDTRTITMITLRYTKTT